MDCYNSFQIRINQNFLAVAGGAGVSLRTWGTAGQYFWSTNFTPDGDTSRYDITGFKNVNIYGIICNGYVRGNSNSANKCAIVEDWNFFLSLNGTPPLISGEKLAAPNGWNIISTGTNLTGFHLSKNTNSIMLANPITSVKSITFDTMYAQGIGAEFLNEVALNYGLNFTFYYRYEGED